MKNLNRLTATEMIKGLSEGNFSVTELTNSHIAHITKIEDKIQAWVYFDKNSISRQIAEIENKKKTSGRLSGILVGVKDTFNTFDMPTEMGSIIWRDYTPGNDARVIYQLRQEGALILGKTVTAEFAVHTEGKTLNPHNFDYSPGTSSSGSAVAVAAYMVPLALGTQTGGSTIRPASYNGIYGMKPSFGLIPRTGMLKTTDTLDTVGFFARSVEDLRLMLDVVRVRGDDYPFVKEFLEDPNKQIKKEMPWRVALVKTHVWEYAKEYVKNAIHNFAKELSKNKNISLEEIDLTNELKEVHKIHTTIYDKTLSYYFNKEYGEHLGQLSSVLREIISRGNKISFNEYKEALEKQVVISAKINTLFDKYDILLINSTSAEAPKKNLIEDPDTCLIWTFCGLPTINLPVFKSPNNMPFGAQIVSKKYKDYFLLNFATFLKQEGYIKDGTYPEYK